MTALKNEPVRNKEYIKRGSVFPCGWCHEPLLRAERDIYPNDPLSNSPYCVEVLCGNTFWVQKGKCPHCTLDINVPHFNVPHFWIRDE